MSPPSAPQESSSPNPGDVRMRGFSHRAMVDHAIGWLDERVRPLPSESVSLDEAAGRVLAVNAVSRVAVPGFDRAMMDGFAVRAEETDGASTYDRRVLTIVGQVLPGSTSPPLELQSGQAARIMTGAPLPPGANAVVPVEQTQTDGDRVWVTSPVSTFKHIGRRGEDIAVGDLILSAGRRLRPQDVGVLSSVGLDDIRVHRRPRVRVVITGNEILPTGSVPSGAQIVDANGPMLGALVDRDGGILTTRRILPDEEPAILDAMRDDVDVVLVSGGSSVGIEDYAPRLLAAHGQLRFHGLAMRPSSPTGMGTLGERLVFLLPGNPVSCLCAYDFFAGRAIRSLGGRDKAWPYRSIRLPLRRKLISQVGRVDYARVSIVEDHVEPLAISGASMLTSTTRADGFVVIPEDSEGFPPDTDVKVYMYDE